MKYRCTDSIDNLNLLKLNSFKNNTIKSNSVTNEKYTYFNRFKCENKKRI